MNFIKRYSLLYKYNKNRVLRSNETKMKPAD